MILFRFLHITLFRYRMKLRDYFTIKRDEVGRQWILFEDFIKFLWKDKQLDEKAVIERLSPLLEIRGDSLVLPKLIRILERWR